MPAKHTLHVALTQPLLEFVALQVATGRYATASSVMREGLELLLERAETSKSLPEPSEQTVAARHG